MSAAHQRHQHQPEHERRTRNLGRVRDPESPGDARVQQCHPRTQEHGEQDGDGQLRLAQATPELRDDGHKQDGEDEPSERLEREDPGQRGDVVASQRDRVDRGRHAQDHLVGGEELVVITEQCLEPADQPDIEAYLRDTNSLLLPPVRYEGGRKIGRVLALDPENLTNLYRDLAAEYDVTVEAKRELAGLQGSVPFVSLVDALPTLTARQRQVLRTAHRRGYFAIPREVTMSAVADEVGVSRRTAEEHLRRAENKLVDALVEYL